MPAARIRQPGLLIGLLNPATETDVVLLTSVYFLFWVVNPIQDQSITTKAGRGGEEAPVPATSMSHPRNQLHQRQVGQWPPAAGAALPGSVR